MGVLDFLKHEVAEKPREFVFGGYLFRRAGEGYHLVAYYPKDWSEVPPAHSRWFPGVDDCKEWVNQCRSRANPPLPPVKEDDPDDNISMEAYENVMSARRSAAKRRKERRAE